MSIKTQRKISRREFMALGLAAAALAACSRIPGVEAIGPTVTPLATQALNTLPVTGGATPGVIAATPKPSAGRAYSAQTWLAASRLTFGARLEDLDWIETRGVDAFIEEQLAFEQIDDSALSPRLQDLATLNETPSQLAQETRRAVLLELQQATLLRAVYSRRQLYELMCDFWSNHFNIYFAKNADYALKTVDDREVVRKHALGTFRELLVASAHSPAMLVYLDNNTNLKDHPNENYARELMELHTIGVNGGYTQTDVSEVARTLTGWSVYGPKTGKQNAGTFVFAQKNHDEGLKKVLGLEIQAGGEKDGEAVLDLLASHPSCAEFLCTKLARRFIADDPPAAAVQAGIKAFQGSKGDLRSTLGAILHSPEFKASAGQKMRRPFEFVAAALRGLGTETDAGKPIQSALMSMGQPLFLWSPPNGFPDLAQAWVNAGSYLARWNFALALASNSLAGSRVDLAHLAGGADALAGLSPALLGGPLPSNATQALAPFNNPDKLPELAALLIACPLFQYRG